ncbi:hypothetical protein A2533_02785 [Candidatus Falkowbacteria bacterium RIFOXYD2_FULL_35_9]|uniref:alanine--tRNA ligase n=1 Tax=Candidatus Falkowbacteria bacterium RIFOXYC2_FULL_36_12 TaxID=1798002 RepID=A0A1F5SYC6_9BACT|nr:MAG: hypothetical protein A2478_04135 [Candidatus Falkowbacteria bacterium RIFOXYC2_FULL_36_12]OGF46366.1 MAG: hypothetical protein A2533_02785 [Candidatus Falkowbacteria bacterium RIFOXYD2_FULL_35_9]
MFLSSKDIRNTYLNFFNSKEHTIISSASLIPQNDSTLLFTNSGMSPLVPYLLGEKHPGGSRLTNCQKSFRTEDIEDVGDNRHTTFFEMLGNWSLGDYFKNDQLNWWYELLIDKFKLDSKKLYQSVYVGDDSIEKDNDSIRIISNVFSKYGIIADEGPETTGKGDLGPGFEIDFNKYRIFAYRDKNWWQRGDAIGELGGPDSETFYDTGKKHNPKFGRHCHVNCDCGRFLEIGNSVFMQYQKTKKGWVPLANKNVDFGGGLERITMILQNKDNIFETDLFINVLKKIESLSGKKYRDNMSPFEIIADHLKAATFIMGDDKGITPSNVDQGYVVRRLIRRALRYGMQIGIAKESWTYDIAETIISDYSEIYPELDRNKNFILNSLNDEENKFIKTLEKGLIEVEKIYNNIINKGAEFTITGEQAFNIYQTYGFPIEMIHEEIKKRNGKIINEEDFQKFFKKHQDTSRTAAAGKFKGGLADHSIKTTALHTAAHLLLAALRKLLGDQVTQKGSNINAERLRYDFSYPSKLTPSELEQIENLVNDAIKKNLSISQEELTVNEAKKRNAIGVFDSKYGEKVKVYKIAKDSDVFSYEICGGPHLDYTGKMGKFKITKEESSSAGVRRIKAILIK